MKSTSTKNSHRIEITEMNKTQEKEKKIGRKIYKSLESFLYEKIPGTNKTSFKKSKNTTFNIKNPEIFKSSINNSYLIIGETKIENNFDVLEMKK